MLKTNIIGIGLIVIGLVTTVKFASSNQEVKSLGNMKQTFEKSIVSAIALRAGDILSEKMLCYKKPGNGIPTKYVEEILGRKINRDLKANVVFEDSFIENFNILIDTEIAFRIDKVCFICKKNIYIWI